MDIMSGWKKWILLAVVAVVGGAVFVYFDPFNLDLLGHKVATVVAAPKVSPHVATPAAKPANSLPPAQQSSAASKAPVAAIQVPVSAVPPAVQQQSVKAVTPAPAATSNAKPVQATQSSKPEDAVKSEHKASQPSQTELKSATTKKLAQEHKIYPKDADLRHCLELESNAAIAKCAGE
jgi:hypothetical protein